MEEKARREVGKEEEKKKVKKKEEEKIVWKKRKKLVREVGGEKEGREGIGGGENR